MSQRLISSIAGFAIVGALTTAAGSTDLAGVDATKRTVYVSVLDKNGAPVKDIQAADLEVKEGGKTMEIVSVKPATAPFRIALIDCDGGYGAYQLGLKTFMEKLLGHAEFSLTAVIVQPRKVLDYSADPPALVKGLEEIGRRGVQRGGQLMEAISDATQSVRAEGKRPVIVVTRIGGEATSSISPKDVREQLRKSGAVMYVVSVRGVDRTATDTGSGNSSSMTAAGQQAQLRDSEQNEGAVNLQQVLNDGSKESGGHFEEVVSTTMVPTFEKLGDELLNQYEVVYAVPEGVKPSDKLSVATKRKGVTLYAPNRPPM